MATKRKLSELKVVDGKVPTTRPSNLEQIFGFNDMARYNTLDENEYLKKLVDMNRTDLEAHAKKIGVIVSESLARTRENCLKEFRNYVTYLHQPVSTTKPVKATEAALKVLNEGK